MTKQNAAVTEESFLVKSVANPSYQLRAALCKYQLSSFGREKMKSLKLSQKNGLYK